MLYDLIAIIIQIWGIAPWRPAYMCHHERKNNRGNNARPNNRKGNRMKPEHVLRLHFISKTAQRTLIRI